MSKKKILEVLNKEIMIPQKLYFLFQGKYIVLEYEDGSVIDITVDIFEQDHLFIREFDSIDQWLEEFNLLETDLSNPFSEEQIAMLKLIPGVKNIYGADF